MGTLTLTNMQDLVQNLAGDDSAAMFPDAMVTTFLNQSLIDVARKTEAYIKNLAATTLSTVSDFTALAVPSDFLLVHRLRWNNQPLYPIPREQAKRHVLEAGTPFAYYNYGLYLRFYPESTATSGLDIDLDYVAVPPLLSAGSDVTVLPAHYDMDVVQGAVLLCKQRDEDNEGYQLLTQRADIREAQSKYERQVAESDSYAAIQDIDAPYQPVGPWLY